MSKREKESVANEEEVDVKESSSSGIIEGNPANVKNLVHAHPPSGDELCWLKGHVQLRDAIKGGNVETAKSLLRGGAEVDCETDGVNTLLHYATWRRCDNPELVRLLLEKNARVDALNDENETPLHSAIKIGCPEIVQVLLDHNASLTAQTNEGATPFLLAMKDRRREIVRMLLLHAFIKDEGADLSAASLTGKRNSNFLDRTLLCDPNVRDKVNKLVVRIITEDYPRCNIIDDLIEYGFTLSREYISESLLLNATGGKYTKFMENILIKEIDLKITECHPSLLHKAVSCGHVKMVKLYLNAGFDSNAKDKEGKTPICYSLNCCTETKSVKIIQLLLASGALIKEAPELLHTAVEKGLIEVCKELMKNGVDINAQNAKGETPLHLAVEKRDTTGWRYRDYGEEVKEANRVEIAKLLLSKDAAVNVKATDGRTAFHRAVSSGKKEVVGSFLNFGIYVNMRAEDNSTPLHIAADEGHEDIVDILCKNHANVDARRNDGYTPLHCCSWVERRGNDEIVRTLLNNGCDFNAETSDGETALDIVISSAKSEYLAHNECLLSDLRIDDMIGRSYHLQPGEEGPELEPLENYIEDYDLHEFDVVRTLKKHLIKLEVAGLYVSEKNAGLVDTDYCFPDFKKKCEEEVKQLKRMKSNTLYDALVNSKNISHVKKITLLRLIKSLNFKRFPKYKSLILNNLKKRISRLELLCQGRKALDALVKTSSRLNGNKCSVLPAELLEHTLSYLNDCDLRSLINCAKGLKNEQ